VEIKYSALLLFTLAGLSFALHAEEGPEQYCNSAIKLYKEGDIEGALEEARWCLESLEQVAQAKQTELFSTEIGGWVRGKVNQQKAMGISTIDATYSKDDKSIKVELTGGAAGSMGALAAISQLGMAQAGNKVRIQRYTAIVSESDRDIDIMIGLKQGGMLNFSSSNAGKDVVIEFAKAFPIKELDQ
jgi:hypothetical protein